MDSLTVVPVNSVHTRLKGTPEALLAIRDHFSFSVPGAKFTPAYKSGYWDGKIRLFDMKTKLIYAGLTHRIKQFCLDSDIDIEYDEPIKEEYSDEELLEFISKLKIPSKFQQRDYQLAALRRGIEDHRALFLSPTSSGKSMMIYQLVKWFRKKTLIIVPTKALVYQMSGDFEDYGMPKAEVHKIAGGERWSSKEITISTWQSAKNMDQDWFDQFDMVVGDEAHLFSAKSLVGIMEKLVDCDIRFGFTGSLDGSKCNAMILEGLFGRVMEVTTNAEMMERGYSAKIKMRIIMLKYSDEERKPKRKFQDEMEFLITHNKRNEYLCDLAENLSGNTLMMFHRVEVHGKPLFEEMQRRLKGTGRNVYFIHGGVDGEIRDKIRAIIEKETDCVVVASSGTTSTGINIKRLHNIISCTSWKSRVLNLQTMGRGFRMDDDKDTINYFDITDDLSWKKRKNYTLLHCYERIRLYAEQTFKYKIIEQYL